MAELVSEEALLDTVLGACGAERGRATVQAALDLARREAPAGDDASRLEAAARRCGVHATSRRGPLARAARQAPAVIWGPEPVVVLAHDGRVARVDAGDAPALELDDAALARRVGVAGARAEVRFTTADAVPLAEGDHGHESPLRRVLALLRREMVDLRAIVVLSLGVSVLTLATPVAADQLVSSIAFGGLVQPIVVLSIVLLGCLALAGALRALQAHVAELVQRRILVRVLADLVHRLPRVPHEALARLDAPELVNRFYDVVTVQKAVAFLLVETFALVLSATVGLLVLAFYHPLLLAFDVALVLAAFAVVFLLGRGAARTSIDESHAKHAIVAFLEELARSRAVMGTRAARALAVARGDEYARAYLRARASHWAILFRQIVASLGLQALGATSVLAFGGALVLSGSLTIGQLVAAEIIVTVVLGSIAKLGKHLESLYDLVAAADKVGHLLDLPVEAPGAERLEGTGPARVDVTGPTPLALLAGERVAVTGPSGSGKSRLLARIAGRDAGEGTVLVDGRDVRSVDPESLAAVVALVGPEPSVIGGTILDNVRLGRPGIDAASVRQALADVGLGEAIAALPGGLREPLGPRGEPLSRGQLARLGLAAAIAGRPRLLLVDGVLETLDPATRARVIERLAAPDAGWTLVCATTSEVAPALSRTVALGEEHAT